MSIRLTDFKASIQDIARPNRFMLTMGGAGVETAGGWSEKKSFLIKTASLPNRVIGNIELNWQGMKAKIAGDPTVDDLTITVLNSYDWDIKNFFESWMENIATMASNERSSHQDYKAEITLDQLGRTGEVLASYTLVGAYPISMDAVELSMDSTDTVQELSISLTFDTFFRQDSSGISSEV